MPRRSTKARVRATDITYTTNCFQAKAKFEMGGDRSGTMTNGFNVVWNGTGTPGPTNFTALRNAVVGFYNGGLPGSMGFVSGSLATCISRVADSSQVNVYEVNPAGPEPDTLGEPIFTDTWTLGAADSGTLGFPLPNQICVCVSFRADYGTDEEYGTHVRPRADDRGRIYLGPLSANVVSQTGVGLQYACLSTAAQTTFQNSLQASFEAMLAANWNPAVWSRKEKVFKLAVYYGMNNSFDNQRRRSTVIPAIAWNPVSS